MKMNIDDVEVDEQVVLENMNTEEIFEKSGIEELACKNVFGALLLKEFTPAEIVEYYGYADLLNEIGEDAAIKHFSIEVAEAQ